MKRHEIDMYKTDENRQIQAAKEFLKCAREVGVWYGTGKEEKNTWQNVISKRNWNHYGRRQSVDIYHSTQPSEKRTSTKNDSSSGISLEMRIHDVSAFSWWTVKLSEIF